MCFIERMWSVCEGMNENNEMMKYVNANNIDRFIGCEIINGPLLLLNQTLDGWVCLLLDL